jgi:hypothetical protein
MKIEVELPIDYSSDINKKLGKLGDEVREIFNVDSIKIEVKEEPMVPGTTQIMGWYNERRL